MLDASHVLLMLTRATLIFLLPTCLLFSQWASCKLHKCMLTCTPLKRRMIWKLIKSSANPTLSPWSACRFPLRIQRRDLVSVPVSFLLKDSSHLGWELTYRASKGSSVAVKEISIRIPFASISAQPKLYPWSLFSSHSEMTRNEDWMWMGSEKVVYVLVTPGVIPALSLAPSTQCVSPS